MFPSELNALAERFLQACRDRELRVVTAESCSGGLIAGCLTEVAGSSDVLQAGFVTYANEAKETMLDVPPSLIRVKGAVSAEVVLAMARGALSHSSANIAIAVSGIAGPGGGTPEKPVGLVHIAVVTEEGEVAQSAPIFDGNRSQVRLKTVQKSLEMALALITAP